MAEESTPQVFKNVFAVYKWLKANDYKVSKSKLYNDAGKDPEKALLRMEPDGTVTIEAVRRYLNHPEAGVREHMEKVQAGTDHELKEYQRRTVIAKMRKVENEVEQQEIEIQTKRGELLPREDLYLEMAGRTSVLEQGFKGLVQVRAADWVHVAGGDVNRSAELREAILAEFDVLLNEFARTDVFQVLFEEEG
jgi:hypothetical protein